jgi:hypothetical protein
MVATSPETARTGETPQPPADLGAMNGFPVGQGEYVVSQGECISSIAKDAGHFWKTIWYDEANAELRKIRKNPGALLPGDRVHVPEIRLKEQSCVTDKRHLFVRRGEPAFLELRILRRPRAAAVAAEPEQSATATNPAATPPATPEGPDSKQFGEVDLYEEEAENFDSTVFSATDSNVDAADEAPEAEISDTGEIEEPRANEPYVLVVDGQLFEGATDSEGRLRVVIPGNARRGRLIVGPQDDQVSYDLLLGGVDPIDEISGIQQRLANLGFSCGSEIGEMGPQTGAALREFQERHKLPVTGAPDRQTRDKLLEIHRS